MKTRHITALVTFVVAFAFSAFLVALLRPPTVSQTRKVIVNRGCRTPTAQRITQLLEQDINNGFTRRDYISRQISLAVRTENYVGASENLSYEDLPANFQTAWQNHMNAWRKQADLLNTLEDDFSDDETTLRMSSHYTNEINRTWWEVLRIAKEHGAMIPQGAY